MTQAVFFIVAILFTYEPTKARTIEWSGHEWVVRSRADKAGPGPNYWSDSEESVWVDEQGQLHLKIRRENDKWVCAEIRNKRSLGHGTYLFFVSNPVNELDKQTVAGMFVYADDLNEIDIELSRWGENRRYSYHQFVVHPAKAGNMLRNDYTSDADHSIHGFLWQPRALRFESYIRTGSKTKRFRQWLYRGRDNFSPGAETVRINHWLYQGKPPSDGKESELIIEKFTFVD